MENTSGFYKKDGEHLIYGPNFVLNAAYELHCDKYDQYSYPIDGWHWFDNSDSAYTFFGLKKPEVPQKP